MMPGANSRSRTMWFRLTVVVGSGLLALGLCEAVLHLAWDRPSIGLGLREPSLLVADAELGWRARPNVTRELEVSRRTSVTTVTNSHGFRDGEHSLERSAGVRRLVVL